MPPPRHVIHYRLPRKENTSKKLMSVSTELKYMKWIKSNFLFPLFIACMILLMHLKACK